MPLDRLLRIADRLSQLTAGSPEADRAIHDVLGREGPMLAYSRNEGASRLLLPAGFEWCDPVYSSRAVNASCRRTGLVDGFQHPQHGQWSQTPALAMCGAVLRAWAAEAKRA